MGDLTLWWPDTDDTEQQIMLGDTIVIIWDYEEDYDTCCIRDQNPDEDDENEGYDYVTIPASDTNAVVKAAIIAFVTQKITVVLDSALEEPEDQ